MSKLIKLRDNQSINDYIFSIGEDPKNYEIEIDDEFILLFVTKDEITLCIEFSLTENIPTENWESFRKTRDMKYVNGYIVLHTLQCAYENKV